MSLLTLVTAQFQDLNLKENFSRIVSYIEMHSMLHGFKFIQFETTEAVDNFKIKHGLGYIPEDLVRLKVIGGIVTFHREDFTTDYIVISTTDATKVRMLAGSFHGSAKQGLL